MSSLFKLQMYKSPNHGGTIEPRIIVINFTRSRTLMSSVRWMMTEDSRASTHIIIGRDGKAVQMVPLNVKAWHCGLSSYRGHAQCNNFSIGIELCNWGEVTFKYGMYQTWAKTCVHEDDVLRAAHRFEPNIMRYWEKYTKEQVDTCVDICQGLLQVYPNIEAVVGHDDICLPTGRSFGPGPALDLNEISDRVGIKIVNDGKLVQEVSYYAELIALKNEMAATLKKVNRFIERRDD